MSLSSLICGGSILTNFNNLNSVTQNLFIDWQKTFKGDLLAIYPIFRWQKRNWFPLKILEFS